MKVSELFTLHQGNSFELINMESDKLSDINFIARTGENNGVVAKIKVIDTVKPFPAGLLTVALGGSVLSSFVQYRPFYTGFHVMALEPKQKMRLEEKLFYCHCIQMNAYRYRFGRQANKTLKDIELPGLPDWLKKYTIDYSRITTKIEKKTLPLDIKWKVFLLTDIFNICMGNKFDLVDMTFMNPAINFVNRSGSNNGVSKKVDLMDDVEPFSEGAITLALGGSICSAFLQDKPFYTGQNVAVLSPKQPLSKFQKLFLCTMIYNEKFKYSAFGRELNIHLKTFSMPLPANSSGRPDWEFMENYIKALPYSDKIC